MTQQPIAPPPYIPRPLSESGTVTHALGFLAYIPIPFFSLMIAGLVQVLSYLSVRKRGPRAAEIARPAGNWGATVLIVMAVLTIAAFALAAIANQTSTALPFIPIVAYMVLGLLHLIITIGGTIAASKGQVYVNQIAIKFFKN